MEHPTLILVGGLAGTGKTELGRILARLLRCCYLDKDTMTRPLVQSLLTHIPEADGVHDRESQAYLQHVRPAEYDCILEQAMENLRNGVTVVASAPFYHEVHDPNWFERLKAMTSSLGHGQKANLLLVWLTSTPELAQSRMIQRGSPRDRGKLSNWDEFIQKNDYNFRPLFPHIHVRNGKAELTEASVKPVAARILRGK